MVRLDDSVYSNFANLEVDGSNALTLAGDVSVEQSISALLEEGTTYRLTVAIGDRDVGVLQDFAGARIELLADGVAIADSGDLLSADVVDGSFMDVSFTYTATASDAGGVLGVRLVSLNQNPGSSMVDFDNVRIAVVAAVELISIRRASESALELTWTSVPGRTYAIDAGTDLAGWSEVESQISAASTPATSTTHVIDLPVPELPEMFYRVRIE